MAAMLPFTLQLQDGVPVSDQILAAVRKAMLTGALRAGDVFPSVRTLSQELRISPTTAHKVVLALRDAGLLGSRPGVGMVVTAPAKAALSDKLDQLAPSCRKLLTEAADLGLTFDDVVKALRRTESPAHGLLKAAEKRNGMREKG